MRQRSSKKLGAFLVTLTGTMFWFNVISFVYTTTILWTVQSQNILAVVPWMNLPLFLLCGVIIIAVPMALFEYLIAQPSRQAFSNSQELKHQSPYKDQLDRIESKVDKVLKDE